MSVIESVTVSIEIWDVFVMYVSQGWISLDMHYCLVYKVVNYLHFTKIIPTVTCLKE